MSSEYEVLTFERLRHFKIFLNDITYRNFHTHGAFEFLLVLEGTGCITLSNGTIPLRPGSFVVVNPHEAHEIDARGGHMLTAIFQVSRHFCQEYIPALCGVRFQKQDLSEALGNDSLVQCKKYLLETALGYLREDAQFQLLCIANTARLLHILLSEVPYTVLSEQEHSSLKKKIRRMDRISGFLEENYLRPIRLADLAKRENLSVTYVSHLFTESYGISFQMYLNNLRFEKAMEYLRNTSMSLADVAMSSGFSDPKYLSQMVERRMGCSASAYRSSIRLPADAKVPEKPEPLERRLPPEESIARLCERMDQAL